MPDFGAKVHVLDELATKRSRKPPETVAPASESELLQSSAGEIKPCEHNARVLIGTSPQYAELHFDEFLSRLRIGARDWTDADDLDLLCWLQSAHGVPRFVRARLATVRLRSPTRAAVTRCASLSRDYPHGTARHASSMPSRMPGGA